MMNRINLKTKVFELQVHLEAPCFYKLNSPPDHIAHRDRPTTLIEEPTAPCKWQMENRLVVAVHTPRYNNTMFLMVVFMLALQRYSGALKHTIRI